MLRVEYEWSIIIGKKLPFLQWHHRLNCFPPKDVLKSKPTILQNVTFVRNRVVADIITDSKLRSYCGRAVVHSLSCV